MSFAVHLCTPVQVWKRAISENEEKLNEMKEIVCEKMALQERLITRLQQYVRVHDNTLQRQAPSEAVDSSSDAMNDEDDDEETREQDEHSAELSELVNSLKTMTSDSVQVPHHHHHHHRHHHHLTSCINGHFPVFLTPPDVCSCPHSVPNGRERSHQKYFLVLGPTHESHSDVERLPWSYRR